MITFIVVYVLGILTGWWITKSWLSHPIVVLSPLVDDEGRPDPTDWERYQRERRDAEKLVRSLAEADAARVMQLRKGPPHGE